MTNKTRLLPILYTGQFQPLVVAESTNYQQLCFNAIFSMF